MTRLEELLREVRVRGFAWRTDDICDRFVEWSPLMAWVESDQAASEEGDEYEPDQRVWFYA